VWIGQFKEGALTGKGELIGADGSHYIGQFSDWRFSGQGRLNLSDGSFYIGGFDSDSYQGAAPWCSPTAPCRRHLDQRQRVRDADGKLLPDPSNSACWPRAACWMPRWPPCPPRPRPSSCTP
jgi:hypothetical protein